MWTRMSSSYRALCVCVKMSVCVCVCVCTHTHHYSKLLYYHACSIYTKTNLEAHSANNMKLMHTVA